MLFFLDGLSQPSWFGFTLSCFIHFLCQNLKRFIRDHLRYIDEIQCAAARVVHAMRQLAKKNGNADGEFDTFHIRRGDFQYKQTRINATEIFNNTYDILEEGGTIFIATDERDKSFFKPLRKRYHIYFLDDFHQLISGISPNYYGMLDQRIASRGRTFIGAYYSTFTGYINRMRGYHSQKDKSPGHEKGILRSFYYVELKHKYEMIKYKSVHPPMWGREFPVGKNQILCDNCLPFRGLSFLAYCTLPLSHVVIFRLFSPVLASNSSNVAWRDIDHDVDPADMLSRR